MLRAFENIAFDKENFESWVDMDLNVKLTDSQWEAVVNELDGRIEVYLDEMIYAVVKDFRDGEYDNA